MTRINYMPVVVTALAAMLLPELVQAHVAHTHHSSFVTGLGHPFSGIDHLLVMVGIGIWAAQIGRSALFTLPLMFPLLVALGMFAVESGVALPGIEAGIAMTIIVLGAVVLFRFRGDLRVTAPLVGVFALLHGYAHSPELEGQNSLLFGAGLVAGTALLHAVGIALGLVHQWPWGQRVLRTAGAAILATGTAFLWGALS
jgi:urease accessory protein